MNIALLKEMVAHIYANFGVIPSDFVNLKTSGSLISPYYLLKDKITFEVEGQAHYGKMWGCSMSLGDLAIKVLLADCTLDREYPEFAMIIDPKGNPTYGLYLCHNELSSHPKDSVPMLAVSPDHGQGWMPCNTGLQATFLAGMEQARDLHMPWEPCVEYNELHQAMIGFLKFHFMTYGD
jgi:hypothetical protein